MINDNLKLADKLEALLPNNGTEGAVVSDALMMQTIAALRNQTDV